MWKAVGSRVCLIGGEAVENRARIEMDSFTPEHADQEMGIVGSKECPHYLRLMSSNVWNELSLSRNSWAAL